MQSKIFRVIRMDIEIDVEYLQGNTAIKRKMKQKELAALQRSFVVTRREVVNDYATAEWKKYLMGALRDGETLEDLARYEEILYSITPADLKDACREYLDMERCGVLLMQGEESE